jgi:hypothetical protein
MTPTITAAPNITGTAQALATVTAAAQATNDAIATAQAAISATAVAQTATAQAATVTAQAAIDATAAAQAENATATALAIASLEDCIGFDANDTYLVGVDDSWRIEDSKMILLDFGSNEAEAEQAWDIIFHYDMNDQCFVGRPDAPMEYYLVDRQAPTGSLAGEDCISFNLAETDVAVIEGRWQIVDPDQLLLNFEDKEDEARAALAIIKYYAFEYYCFVGRPDPSMRYFRR